jgi:hypothetical protein
MNKSGLDEMQVQKRNSIGNQTFAMLLYLLMFDVALYGFGFRWVSYPANVMIILVICSGIYVIRLIAANAFVGPSTISRNVPLKVVLIVISAILVSAAIFVFIQNVSLRSPGHIDEMSAPLLFITAGFAIVVAAVTFVINQIRNRDDD